MAVRSTPRSDFLRTRIERAFWMILLCYLALVGRLLYLQGASGPTLREQASLLRQQRIPLPVRRGTLYDREGRPLAVSIYSGTVGFDPSLFQVDPKDRKLREKRDTQLQKSVALAAKFLNLPEAELNQTVTDAIAQYTLKPTRFVPIKRDVAWEVAQWLRDNRAKVTGFGVVDDTKRVYTSGPGAAQVVGFLNGDGVGAAGLEASCNKWLSGRAGYVVAEVDDRRREIPDTLRQMVPSKDGQDVFTTLDTTAQHIATEEAEKVYQKYHPNGVSIVVVEPETGNVLALVSMPNYDPNPGQRATLTPEAQWERCLGRLYEPGSTLKSLTVAAALDAGIIHRDSGFYCGGTLKIGKRLLHCDKHGGSRVHGYETPEAILRHSCNVGAAQIGLRMGAAKLFAAERNFGLLDRLDVGLPAERQGYLSHDHDSPAKTARVAFGHAITTTPLNVTMAYSVIANGGVLMKPRLVTAVKEVSGKVRQSWEPKPLRRVLAAQTSAEVTEMLRAVVANGTGKVAAVSGYQVAGKTGTAKNYGKHTYVGSFIGFLPASPNVKPRVVILVAVDEPQGSYYGADVAAPAFQAIARRLAASWHLPEDDPQGTQYRVAQENLRRSGHIVVQASHEDEID